MNTRRHIISILGCLFPLLCSAQTPEPTQPDGYIGGYGYVDLGLPSGTLWAVHNVGAQGEYECGDYFAWGETMPKEDYSWQTYKYFVAYEEEADFDQPYIKLEDIGWCISGTVYDAATVNWGNGWAMPDSLQLQEIRRYTFDKRVEENGVGGIRVYSRVKEGKSIFLGDFGAENNVDTGVDVLDTNGHYWGGTSMPGMTCSWMRPTDMAQHIMTQQNDDDVSWCSPGYKYAGFCIRPVVKKRSGIDEISIGSQEFSFTLYGRQVKTNRQVREGVFELADMTGRILFSIPMDDNGCILPMGAPGIYVATIREAHNLLTVKKILVK